MAEGGLGGGGILRVDQVQAILWDRSECASSTDGGSSAHTRLSPQPRGDLPRLESPDAEQMHAMAMMQQQNSSNKLNSSDAGQGNASGSWMTSFKHHQLRAMKTYFQKNQNPDAKDLKQLAQKTGLTKSVLQVWFQNARAKHRRTQQHRGEIGGMDGSTPSLFTAMSVPQMHASSVPSSTSVGSGGAIHGEYTPNVGLRTMKTYFQKNQNPDAKDLKQLAQKTGLTKSVLQVWFQNARAKHRRTQQQVQDGQNEGTNAPGAAAIADESSLLFDPSLSALSGACPLVNIIDSPPTKLTFEGTETDKTEPLELCLDTPQQKVHSSDTVV